MGKVSKGAKCSVEGCDRDAVRSLDLGRVYAAGLKVRGERRAFLCKEHYKEYKKATKKDRIVDRWRKVTP
ncbi:MAG: hypothetical protein QW600_02535 [Candidatus Bathyarchaeia archaeon]|nr:hypothetical protein [Candidatus Bathyarchaeota archaeon]